MTVLRKNAMDLLEKMPEDQLFFVVQILQGINGFYETPEQEVRDNAFEKLENLRRKNVKLDYDKELESYRQEKYGTANID